MEKSSKISFCQSNVLGACCSGLVSTAELHFHSSSGIPHLPIFVPHGLMARWPFWPYLAIYDTLAIRPHANNMGKRGIPEKSYKNVIQRY